MTPYQYCGNNPIMFTDPTGMSREDWRFTFKNGILISVMNTGKGDNIFFNVNGRDVSLNSTSSSNKMFFAEVTKYFTNLVDSKLWSSYDIVSNESTTAGYHVPGSDKIVLTSLTYSNSSNYYNILNTVYHEKLHVDRGRSKSYKDHAFVYRDQTKHSSFSKTSQSYRYNNAKQFAQRMINSFAAGEYGGRTENFYNDINQYNKLNPDYKVTPNLIGEPSIRVGNSKEDIYPKLDMKYGD